MSTLTVGNIQNLSGTASTSSDNVIRGCAKAWVTFNAVTSTINAAYNISSLTQVSTGNWQANFTVPMPNTNYAIVIGVNGNSVANYGAAEAGNVGATGGATTHAGLRSYRTDTAAPANLPFCNIAVFM